MNLLIILISSSLSSDIQHLTPFWFVSFNILFLFLIADNTKKLFVNKGNRMYTGLAGNRFPLLPPRPPLPLNLIPLPTLPLPMVTITDPSGPPARPWLLPSYLQTTILPLPSILHRDASKPPHLTAPSFKLTAYRLMRRCNEYPVS